mgnify:FL=1
MRTKDNAAYTDSRHENNFRAREALRNKGMVYKNNYELVMEHSPIKWSNSSTKSSINQPPRTSGGTLNGSSYR